MIKDVRSRRGPEVNPDHYVSKKVTRERARDFQRIQGKTRTYRFNQIDVAKEYQAIWRQQRSYRNTSETETLKRHREWLRET